MRQPIDAVQLVDQIKEHITKFGAKKFVDHLFGFVRTILQISVDFVLLFSAYIVFQIVIDSTGTYPLFKEFFFTLFSQPKVLAVAIILAGVAMLLISIHIIQNLLLRLPVKQMVGILTLLRLDYYLP